MSVLIKNLEMPQNCEECNLESFCDLWVDARRMCGETFSDSKSRIKATIRHPDCPLIELPPHGRLIDSDALKAKSLRTIIQNGLEHDRKALWQMIDDTPTIIESEG